MNNLMPITVIAFHPDTRQTVAHHVMAHGDLNAFSIVANQSGGSNLEMVVAIHGHLKEGSGLTFPGEGLVDGETVLKQPEVFGEHVAAQAVGDELPYSVAVISAVDVDQGTDARFLLACDHIGTAIDQAVGIHTPKALDDLECGSRARCASRIAVLANAYHRFTGADGAGNLVDILTDIRHFCDSENLNFIALDQTSYLNYSQERHSAITALDSTLASVNDLYLLVMQGDVEPDLRGPYDSDDVRLAAAREYRATESGDDGLYRLDVPKGVVPDVTSFSGGEMSGANDPFIDFIVERLRAGEKPITRLNAPGAKYFTVQFEGEEVLFTYSHLGQLRDILGSDFRVLKELMMDVILPNDAITKMWQRKDWQKDVKAWKAGLGFETWANKRTAELELASAVLLKLEQTQ